MAQNNISKTANITDTILPRDAMQARPMSSCGVCLSVRPSVCLLSVTFVDHVKTNKHIIKNFSPLGTLHSNFSVPNGIAIFRREPPPPNRGVECRWGVQKSRF